MVQDNAGAMPRDLLPPARFYLLKASQPEIVPPAEGQVTKSESPGEGGYFRLKP